MIARSKYLKEQVFNSIKKCKWRVYQIGELVFSAKIDAIKYLEGHQLSNFDAGLEFIEWHPVSFRVLRGTHQTTYRPTMSLLLSKINKNYCKFIGEYDRLLDIPDYLCIPESKKQTIRSHNVGFSHAIQF